MSDMDTRLRRDAHGWQEAIDQPRPRYDYASRRAPRRWTTMAAAAAVVLIAVGIGVVVSRHRGSTDRSASRAMDGVIGYRWQVTSISDSHGKAAVAASLGALVTFGRDGVVGASDTVNDLSGKFRVVAAGYALTGGGSATQVAGRGSDPIRKRTIAAVDTLFGVQDGRSSSTSAVLVTVRLRDGVLTLSRQGVTVTATRAGAQPDPDAKDFNYLGPVTRTAVVAGGALVLRPPGASVARITPAQAFDDLCTATTAPAPCAGQTGKADMVLALLTTPNTGHLRADGATKPSVENVLSYVLSWHPVPCPYYGGPALSGKAKAPTLPIVCTETNGVSATTGRWIAGDYYNS